MSPCLPCPPSSQAMDTLVDIHCERRQKSIRDNSVDYLGAEFIFPYVNIKNPTSFPGINHAYQSVLFLLLVSW